LYIVYYDIGSNKVRNYISRYLERKGLERIQRSVFAGRTSRDVLEEITESLRMVNSVYDNEDSIIILPIGLETYKAMRLIGKNTGIRRLAESPHTLYI
jgi:CRISPR-associated endonuclease Cas2